MKYSVHKEQKMGEGLCGVRIQWRRRDMFVGKSMEHGMQKWMDGEKEGRMSLMVQAEGRKLACWLRCARKSSGS